MSSRVQCDETGLDWKGPPDAAAGGNAAGDCTLKLLLVGHVETPPLKAHSKTNLPSSGAPAEGLGHQARFQEWFTYFFCPAVEKYCAQSKLSHSIARPGHCTVPPGRSET